MFTKLKY